MEIGAGHQVIHSFIICFADFKIVYEPAVFILVIILKAGVLVAQFFKLRAYFDYADQAGA